MAAVQQVAANNVLSFSSVGQGGDQFRPRSVLEGDRWRELDGKQSVYECSRHDAKLYDFDGRVVSPRAMQPLISAEKSPVYIPLNMRRPSTPVRLGKTIVDAFTNLLFGENRFPAIKVEGDENREDFVRTISRVGRLPATMIRARSLGGAMGTVGVSWCFHEGRPRFEVHNAKHLHVHSWIDRLSLKPQHVTEVYLFHKVKWDGKGFNKQHYWYRRDWTPEADFVFHDVPFEKNKDPIWEVDEELSSRHGDGVLHFEWIQNLPTDEIDGTADYDGLYDQLDQLDVLSSTVMRGAIMNLDPTLKLKVDPNLARMGGGVKKGSDNALLLGQEGDAEYMELSGTSVDAGIKLLTELRRSILETAQCVVADPNEIASQGTSSVAMKMMYAPMLARADVLREQYAAAVTRMLENMVTVARMRMDEEIVAVDPETGEQAPARFVLSLPPRIVRMDQADPMTGEVVAEAVPTPIERDPGSAGEVELTWPPYFQPTYDDQSKMATTLQMATGGKAFVSGETASDLAAAMFGVEPSQERERMSGQIAADNAAQAAMFPPMGGPAGALPPADPNALPELPLVEGEPEVPPVATPPAEAQVLKLTASDLAAIVTVNEARASVGLPPLPGTDGNLTMPEFKAKHSGSIAVAAQAEKGGPGAPPAGPPPFHGG